MADVETTSTEVVDVKAEFISLMKDLLDWAPKVADGSPKRMLTLGGNAYKDGQLVTYKVIGGTKPMKIWKVFADIFKMTADKVEATFEEMVTEGKLQAVDKTYPSGTTRYYMLPGTEIPQSAGASASVADRSLQMRKIFNR